MTRERQKDFAARLGCHHSRVSRLKRDGRLVMSDDGLVEIEASLELIAATRGTRFDRDAGAQGPQEALPGFGDPTPPPEPEIAADSQPAPPSEPSSPLGLAEIGLRTRHAQMMEREALARMRAREEQEQAGLLVRRSAVVKAASDAVAIVLNAGETLPDRVAPMLTSCNDQARIRAILRDEIEQLFTIVSTQLGGIARGRAA